MTNLTPEQVLDFFEEQEISELAYCQDDYEEWLEGMRWNGKYRCYERAKVDAISYLFETMNEHYTIDDLRHNLTLEKQKDELMQDYGPTR